MVILRSIPEKYGEDVDREIYVNLTQMMQFIQRLEQKMSIMFALANTLQNEAEKKEFIASTEKMKDDHDNLKKRFTDFVAIYHLEKDFAVVFSQIGAFMKQELDNNDKLRQLYIKFLREEDQNFLDFLSDDEDNLIGFPPLERPTNEGLAHQSADGSKAKLLSSQDGEESEKDFEAIKKDDDETEIFLKKLEQQHDDISKIQELEENMKSLMLPGVSSSAMLQPRSNKDDPGVSSSTSQPRSNQDEDQDRETGLKEWLNLHKNGNEDRNAMNGLKGLAIDLASNLSRLLLEFMIIMSDQEGIKEKLRTFKSTLRALREDDDTFIMEKMVTVMTMVENEAFDKKTKAGISVSLEKSQVDEFIGLFFELLLHLKNVISSAQPNSIELTEGLESELKSGLEQCNAQLREVESKVNELKILISCYFESEKLKSLWLRIVVMWDRVKNDEIGEGSEQTGNAVYSYPMQLFLKM